MYLFVSVQVTRRMELEVARYPDGDDYADLGLRWGDENGQEFGFVHIWVEMPIRHPCGNVREALW